MIYREKISKIIQAYVPGNLCNFRCSYCYVSECLRKEHCKKSEFKYSLEQMIDAFRPERIGGIAFIGVIGGGETLLPEQVVPFVKGLLAQGHVVEVVTNNTINERIEELLCAPEEDLKRLIVKCSLHWNELKRLNKVEDYFSNMKKVIAAGASAYPFIVICDEYMPHIDEIIRKCLDEVGVLPQCTPCVMANTPEQFYYGSEAVTQPACTQEFIKMIDEKFQSNLFDESVRMLSVNPNKVFCYAGLDSFVVDIGDGKMSRCHNVPMDCNFFEDTIDCIDFRPVGCECGIVSCGLQYQFYGAGLIPEVSGIKTYAEMISRKGLINDTVYHMMNFKLYGEQDLYTKQEQIDFLMDRVNEKDSQIREQYQMIMQEERANKKNYEILENLQNSINHLNKAQMTDEERVNDLLDIVNQMATDGSVVKNVEYRHIDSLRKVCNQMENGDEMFDKIFRKVFENILDNTCQKGD